MNLELCKKDFRSDWEAVQMGYSVYDNLPPKFSDFLIGHVAGLVAEKTESNIWGGVNGNAGEFDGFTVLMAADSDVNDASNGSETSFTSSNIVTLLSNVVDAIPNAVYGKEDLKIYAPPVAFQAYIRHLGGYGANGFVHKVMIIKVTNGIITTLHYLLKVLRLYILQVCHLTTFLQEKNLTYFLVQD